MLLFFGGSIFVHELGHFLAAKMRGLKVLRFSIGFGPRIFSWKGKDGCDYIISLLPLGGYVALPQLADMGALEGGDDKDAEIIKNLPPASSTDKIIVSAAGAFFNLIFATILAAIVWVMGISESTLTKTTVIGYIPEHLTDVEDNEFPSPAKKAGLKEGDKILEIDGTKVEDFSQIIELIAIGSGRDAEDNPQATLKILRDGKELELTINPILLKTNLSTGDEFRMIGVSPASEIKIAKLMENSPAQKAGIKKGDIVKAVDKKILFSNTQLSDYLDKLPNNAKVKLDILRDGKNLTLEIYPQKIKLTRPYCEFTLPSGSVITIFEDLKNSKTSLKVLRKKGKDEYIENIHSGMTLYAINGENLNSLKDLSAISASLESGARFSFIDPLNNLSDFALPKKSKLKINPPETRTMLGFYLDNSTIITYPSILKQFSDSISRTWNALSSLVNPKSDIGISSLAGPVDIGRVIYKLSTTAFSLVLSFIVLLNINLAILNLLPIPVLDGGHILFAIIERIRGKALSTKVFASIQGTFSLLFLALMCYVIYCGFMRWNGDAELENMSKAASSFYLKDISFKNHE